MCHFVYYANRLGKRDRAIAKDLHREARSLPQQVFGEKIQNRERGGCTVMLQWQAKSNTECGWDILSRNLNILHRGVFATFKKTYQAWRPTNMGAPNTIAVNWTPLTIWTNSSIFLGRQNRRKTSIKRYIWEPRLLYKVSPRTDYCGTALR